MRFDRVAIPLSPRTTANCLDLALVFLRQYFGTIARIWASVTVPVCAIVYVLVDRFDGDLRLAVLAFFLATSPLGILLVAGTAPAAFGEPFTFRGTWSRLWQGRLWLFAAGLGLRILAFGGLSCFIIPGVWLMLRTSFQSEQAILSHMARHLHDRRTNELLKGKLDDLLGRAVVVFAFCGMLWIVLFITIDLCSGWLLGFPILIGRLHFDLQYLEDLGNQAGYLGSFLWSDPVVVTALLGTAFMVYPLGRLAWFFCYIDARVRRDCWDMELQIMQESQRLELPA